MENKSLGRGFREISNIFISKDGKGRISPKKSKKHPGRSSRSHSDESAKCLQGPLTVGNQERDAHGNDKTAADSATADGNHEAILSDLMKNSGECSDLAENMREVEEHVTVEKNISYPNTPDSRQNMIKALCEHLEEGFSIKTIELIKTNTKCRPGKKKSKTEKVTISLEDPPALAGI
ncbi:MAG: hypothetical protein R6X10_11275 [Desulfobacterales bacterium]